uniref:Small ribosomal subunit protein uS19 n=1 Tax=Ignisphaera aggregans TaxID=334771 RepID=A0A7C2VH35_9CREN
MSAQQKQQTCWEMPLEWQKFRYRGKTLRELLEMPMDELVKILPARARRSLLRGFTPAQRKLLEKVIEAKQKLVNECKETMIKTHVRDMVILPVMIGLRIAVHNGKEFVPVRIVPEMIGHFLGEFAPTTRQVRHGEPGLKATRSTLFVALK